MKFIIATVVLLLFTVTTYSQLSLWATYYYIPSFSNSETGIPLLNTQEKSNGFKLDSCDWCSAAIEGTVIIQKDNTDYLFNYAGRSKSLQYDCRKCAKYSEYNNYQPTGKVLWTKISGYGWGVKNYKLVPYRTIAVDPSVIAYGSVIYIPSAKGMKFVLDNGETLVHDGYFFASDTGSAIKGNHIDIFTGKNKEEPFSFVKSDPKIVVEASVVKDQEVIDRLLKMHL